MSKLEKSIGALFTNNHRYIKFDGSGYYSGHLKSIFEKAAFNAGALTLMGLVALDFALQANHSSIEPETIKNLFNNCAIFAGLALLHERQSLFHINSPINKKISKGPQVLVNHGHKAIDTEGRNLSQSKLSMADIFSLHKGKQVALIHLAIDLCVSAALTPLYGINGFFINSAMVGARAIFLHHICDKLIKGHSGQPNGYVFCDEPPAQRQKEKVSSKIFGGATSPS